jgi:hypothetical protein
VAGWGAADALARIFGDPGYAGDSPGRRRGAGLFAVEADARQLSKHAGVRRVPSSSR